MKLGSAQGYLLDGVLISTIDQLPDVIVEIKLLRREDVTLARQAIASTVAAIAGYRRVASPSAVGWLILVVEGKLSPRGTIGSLAPRPR